MPNNPLIQMVLADPEAHKGVHLTTREASMFTGISESTLETWRTRRTGPRRGPRFVRLGPRIIRYRVGDLLEFARVSREEGASE